MEKRMTTDLLEANQRGPKKAVLEQVEEYQQEVLKERSVYLLRSKCFLIVSKFPQYPDVFCNFKCLSSIHAEIHLSA